MNMKFLFAITAGLMMLTSCNNFRNETEQVSEYIDITTNGGDTTFTIWEGVYTGMMPVSGINENAAIWLFNDSSYQIQTLGPNSSDSLQIVFGDFFIDDSTFVIELMGVDSNYVYFMFASDSLIPLDSESMLPLNDPIAKEKLTMRKKKNGITEVSWKLKEVNGLKVKDRLFEETPTIYMVSDSAYTFGNSGCNYFHGKYKMQDKNGLVFENIASTRRLCPDMKIENQFLEMLNNTQSYSIEADTLLLYNNNTPIGIFVADYLATN